LFEARDADTGVAVRLVVAALIRARREQTYEVESLSMMLVSKHWIPVEGVHELPLIQTLVAQRRRFVKPLRYDARSAAGFAHALLTDAGPVALPLHLLSPFMTEAERMAKERAIAASGARAWVWPTDQPMPSLPAPLMLPAGRGCRQAAWGSGFRKPLSYEPTGSQRALAYGIRMAGCGSHEYLVSTLQRHSRGQTRHHEADAGESHLWGPKYSSKSRESSEGDYFEAVKSTPRWR
jgi:hypothetical protein